jgi:hemerythrin-like domain-containing protein
MDPLEILSNEHGLIRQYLDNLSLAAEKLEEGGRVPREFFEKAVDFSRTFTDKFHHFKEEHVLFMRLAQRKQGAVDAEIEALRLQHERGRSIVTGIADALDGYEKGDTINSARLIENLAAYTSLLRHHIHKEDHIFYPMAREELTDQDEQELVKEFDNAREKSGGIAFEEAHKAVVDMGSILTHMQ